MPYRSDLLNTGSRCIKAVGRQHCHSYVIDGAQILPAPQPDRCSMMAGARAFNGLIGANDKGHGWGR